MRSERFWESELRFQGIGLGFRDWGFRLRADGSEGFSGTGFLVSSCPI